MSQNLQFLVGGVDLTANLDQTSNQWSITKNFSRQGETATFTLIDDHPVVGEYSFTVGIDATVSLTDVGTGAVLFSGLCNKPQFYFDAPNLAHWVLNCVDYTTLGDNATVVADVVNITAGQAILDLVAQADCGIGAETVARGGYVSAGPLISFMRVNYGSLSQAIKDVCKVSSQQSGTSYGWRIDEDLQVHFNSELQNISSGVTLTDDITRVGSVSNTLGYFDDSSFAYSWDATQIHNQVIVLGSQVKAVRTDTFTADGSQTQYLLSFPIDTTVNQATLRIAGVLTTVTIVSSGTAPTSGWYLIPAKNGQWSLHNPSTLSKGVSVALEYHYSAPVVADVANYDSQTLFSGLPNGGVFSIVDANATIATLQAAQAEGFAQLTEFAYAQEQITLTTSPKWGGYIEIGQTFQLDDVLIPDIQQGGTVGIVDTFLVIQLGITGMANSYRTSSMTAVRI